MSLSHKPAAPLVVLAALAQGAGPHALGITLRAAPVTGGGAAPYTYAYTVTPGFNASQLAFSLSDPNVSFLSVTGPLNTALAAGSSETITFPSADGPNGGTFIAARKKKVA